MNPLTLQQAREFIAEKAGWKEHPLAGFYAPDGIEWKSLLPDYFNLDDREALFWMHKAEETLIVGLPKLSEPLRKYRDEIAKQIGCAWYSSQLTLIATAPQRARAFCQVFGFSVEDSQKHETRVD